MVYSKEFRENAVELSGKIGVLGACRETGVCEATLRKWRKKTQERNMVTKENEAEKDASVDHPEDPLAGLPQALRTEWEGMKKVNESCRRTIAMLAEENVTLRKQCEDYLRAIALIAGRW